jgi:hypothetical protein
MEKRSKNALPHGVGTLTYLKGMEEYDKILSYIFNNQSYHIAHRVKTSLKISNAEQVLEQLVKDGLCDRILRKSQISGERLEYRISVDGKKLFKKISSDYPESPYSYFLNSADTDKWWQDWPKRNWIKYDAVKIILTALLTFLLMRVCNLSGSQPANKTTIVLPQDTSGKK